MSREHKHLVGRVAGLKHIFGYDLASCNKYHLVAEYETLRDERGRRIGGKFLGDWREPTAEEELELQ